MLRTNIELSRCKQDEQKPTSSITEGMSKPIPIPGKINQQMIGSVKSPDAFKREQMSALLPFTPPNQNRSNRLMVEKASCSVFSYPTKSDLLERAEKLEAKEIEKKGLKKHKANSQPYSAILKRFGAITNLNRSQSYPQCHTVATTSGEKLLNRGLNPKVNT